MKAVANKPSNIIDEQWVKLDMKGVSAIHLCLADSALFNIVEEKTTLAFWEKLEKLYEAKTKTNKVFLKKQIYSLKM